MPTPLAIMLGVLAGVAITLATMLSVTNVTPTCYEDEVIVWTGVAHDTCIPRDSL